MIKQKWDLNPHGPAVVQQKVLELMAADEVLGIWNSDAEFFFSTNHLESILKSVPDIDSGTDKPECKSTSKSDGVIQCIIALFADWLAQVDSVK